ncbi:MAG: sulfotransferase [Gammaproteobacteria bacterium]
MNSEIQNAKQQAIKLLQQDRVAEARDLLTTLSNRAEADPEVWYRLGAAYVRLRGYEQAEACARKALALRADYVSAMNQLGLVLGWQGRNEEALEIYQQVLKISPENPRAISGLAGIYEILGDYDKAYELVTPLVDGRVGSIDVALVFARVCRHFDCGDKAIKYVNEVIQHPSVPIPERARMLFSLGTLHDAKGECESAFDCFLRANHLKNVGFDVDHHEQNIKWILATYTKETIAKLPRVANQSELPVFIVGMPRSGTSLAEQILASHSRVFGAGELNDINRLVRSMCSGAAAEICYLPALNDIELAALESASLEYLHRRREHAGAADRITDKQPLNFLHLGLIALLFPAARIIHCTRDPLDTCLSCYFLEFLENHYYAYDLANLGQFYVQYHRLMKHWQQVLPLPILEIRYEELVNNPEQVSRTMIEFLDLQWEEQCLRFHESGRLVRTASYDGVRKPIYTKSIGRWQNYKSQLTALTAALEQGGIPLDNISN